MIEKKEIKSWYFLDFLGSGAGSGSVIPRRGSEDPDPDQNITALKHWLSVFYVDPDLLIILADYSSLQTLQRINEIYN